MLFGLMLASYFLSLWLSDLATVTIMLTILEAIFDETDQFPETKIEGYIHNCITTYKP